MHDFDEMAFLKGLAEAATSAAQAAAARHTGARNSKGDAVRAFDAAAHAAIAERLAASGLPCELLSEEGAPQAFGPQLARWRVVVDPVDGSDNFACGLPWRALSSFCIALLPAGAPLDVAQVQAALVRPLAGEQRDFTLADARAGTIRPRVVRRIEQAMVSVELNHHAPSPALARLMARARGVRSLGCCSAALLALARGQLDAHIDMRCRLTPESWLAAGALLIAAGGALAIVDADLKPAPPPADLQERRSLVAAATPELLQQILKELRP